MREEQGEKWKLVGCVDLKGRGKLQRPALCLHTALRAVQRTQRAACRLPLSPHSLLTRSHTPVGLFPETHLVSAYPFSSLMLAYHRRKA